MRKTFIATYCGKPIILTLRTHRYQHGGKVAVTLRCCDEHGREVEPFATLSINVDEVSVAKGEFVANHDVPKEFLADLEARGIIENTGLLASYGYVRDQPIYKLTDKGYELDATAGDGG